MNTFEDMCDQMMMDSIPEMTHMHNDMDNMHHHSGADSTHCDMGIDCDCSVKTSGFGTIPPLVILKTHQLSSSTFSLIEKVKFSESTSIRSTEYFLKDSYSSPPLFLANESFLI